jgi:hypothetical protein
MRVNYTIVDSPLDVCSWEQRIAASAQFILVSPMRLEAALQKEIRDGNTARP